VSRSSELFPLKGSLFQALTVFRICQEIGLALASKEPAKLQTEGTHYDSPCMAGVDLSDLQYAKALCLDRMIDWLEEGHDKSICNSP
jgi:hypothetical protein